MEFSEKLKILRNEKGVSQQTLAEAIFVSRSAVAKWENGIGLPCKESLGLLCEFFSVEESYLISEYETENVEKNKTISKYKKFIIALCTVAVTLIALTVTGLSLYFGGALTKKQHKLVMPSNFPTISVENVSASSYVILTRLSDDVVPLVPFPMGESAAELPLLPYQKTYYVDLPKNAVLSEIKYYFLNDDYSPLAINSLSAEPLRLPVKPTRMWSEIIEFDSCTKHPERSEVNIYFIETDYKVIILSFTYEYCGIKAVSHFRTIR